MITLKMNQIKYPNNATKIHFLIEYIVLVVYYLKKIYDICSVWNRKT